MTFTDFYQGAKKKKPFLHMNFDKDFAWDTKNDKNDRDNRYICEVCMILCPSSTSNMAKYMYLKLICWYVIRSVKNLVALKLKKYNSQTLE